MNANFFSLCQKQFRPDRQFLIDIGQNREFTYGDLERITGSMATWLKEQGLEKGDRVIVQVEKSPENLFWYLACLRSALVYLPLNTGYLEDEIEYFVGNSEPSLVICDPSKLSLFTSIAQCPIFTLTSKGEFSVELPQVNDFKTATASKDDIAVILYTSGTTGKPKGAMISHGNLASNTRSLTEAWNWQENDVLLHALPIFHIHGLFVASHLPLMNGSSIRFLDRFSPEAVLEQLPNSTVYMGVPTNYTRLLAHESFDNHNCSNMRLFTSGSAPLLAQTFEQMKNQTGYEIVERYGMTETGMNTSNPIKGSRKPGTVGRPLNGVEIKIVDEQEHPVSQGEPGNLWVKGRNVFTGYWRMPEKTAEEFTETGYFKTGDIASEDADGYISIVGRSKDLIITGGLNVYPKEIESIIDKIPEVAESAVIGLFDEDFGESVTAVVVANDRNFDPETLLQVINFSLQNLAKFKRPKMVHFVDELPRNTMGKVQKNSLREQFDTR